MSDWDTQLEENLWHLWAHFGRASGSSLIDNSNILRFETPIAALPYNGIFRFHFAENIDQVIDRHFDHFATAEKPFLWMVTPNSKPDDLPSRLLRRGFEEIELITGMVAYLDEIQPAGRIPDEVEIREVKECDDLDALVDFVMWRWQVPDSWHAFLGDVRKTMNIGDPASGIRAWLAWLNGAPVAKAITVEWKGVIGLYGVATRPEARGIGLGREICQKALYEADRGRGLPGVLHSSPMAVSLYERMGFREVSPFRLFSLPESFHV